MRQVAHAQTSVIPSGMTVTSDAVDVDARAVRHQPGQRSGPQAVARGAVGAGVGEEPARDPDGEADRAACPPRRGRRRGRRAAPAAGGAGGRGGPRRRSAGLSAGLAVGQQRGHGRPMVAARRRTTALPRRPRHFGQVSRPSRSVGPAMRPSARPGQLRDVLQGRPRPASSLQTYALTGDLQASQKAVRDAMVVAWHHWRKVSRLEDREDYVRPLAWSRALRRSQARWWSRMKGLDPEVAATLDALAKLPVTQRRVLLLSHLTALPLEGISREVGISRTDGRARAADRDRAVRGQPGRRVHRHPPGARGAPTAGRRGALAAALDHHPGRLRPPPLAHDVRRRRRRRRAGGLRARWSPTRPASGPASTPRACSRARSRARRRPTRRPSPSRQQLTPEALLTADQVGAALGGTWTQGQTSGNTERRRAGLHLPGRAVRRPRGRGRAGADLQAGPAPTPRPAEHRRAVGGGLRRRGRRRDDLRTTAGWYAGCTSPRMQLLTTHKVKGVGRRGDALHAPRTGTSRRRSRSSASRAPAPSRPRPRSTRPGEESPDPAAERGPARQRGRRPLRPAGRRHLRRRPAAQGRAADGDRAGARAAQRGRPAAGHEGRPSRGSAPSRRDAIDQPGRDPLRRDRLLDRRRQPRPDPLVPHPGRRPAAGVRPHPDRRVRCRRSRRRRSSPTSGGSSRPARTATSPPRSTRSTTRARAPASSSSGGSPSRSRTSARSRS